MKILVAPLDWGLGHATRTSCLVGRLLKDGHEVILAGSGKSLDMLSGDYPQLDMLELKSFSPWFFRRLPQWLAITIQVPKFIYYYICEKRKTQKIADRLGIDMIVSDNRYGVRADGCRNIMVTHQLSPIAARWAPEWFNGMLAKMLSRWLNRFDEIWVPDIKPFPDGLAGRLADPRYVRTKVVTVGLLSRLNPGCEVTGKETQASKEVDRLAIISGPEPQRSIMERRIKSMFDQKGGNNVILDGKHHTNPVVISALVENAKEIYCRSGYSTIMDLVKMGRTAYLTPTRGQAEQEYLCERMAELGFKSWEEK